MSPLVEAFYDPVTGTVSYVAYETDGGACAIVDPVLDYEPRAGRTSTVGADRLLAFVRARRLTVAWILETHAHADHLTAAPYLKQRLGGRIAIGDRIGAVQTVFRRIFNLEPGFRCDGSQFDHLFGADEEFAIGRLPARAWYVPGHTPADVAYQVGDAVFVGDTLFMPDRGTARCDFPGGDAHQLYRSTRRLLSLPDSTRLFVCHDYPEGRAPQWQTSVASQRAHNIHLRDGVDEAQFVAMRRARDATLAMPDLLLPAIQVNIRAGAWPPAEGNGVSYLKIPLNQF